MTFEDELRQALRPLAGDVSVTLAGVMAKLPPPRSAWWKPVLWLGLGLGLGCLIGGWWRSAPTAPSAPKADTPKPQPLPAPREPELALARLALGSVKLDVGGDEQPLWTLSRVPAGAQITTEADGQAAVELPARGELRLDHETVVRIESAGRLRLKRGRIWLRVGDQPWRVESSQGTVVADLGVLIVNADEAGTKLSTTALEGDVQMISARGVERRLRQGQACSLSDGVFGDREFIRWRGELLAWHFALLYGEPHQREFAELTGELVKMLENPDFAHFAITMLHQVGPAGGPAVSAALATDLPRSVRPMAATVLADVATYPQIDELFRWLRDPDPEVRQAMYHGIKRVSGIERGDPEFWARAKPAEREQEALDWYRETRR